MRIFVTKVFGDAKKVDFRKGLAAAKQGGTTIGLPLEDFSDERWLDIRRADLLAPVMRARLNLAVTKGCDGVEPDNMDGYTNTTGFPLTAPEQLAYNQWIADEAHQRRLSVGLKNDIEQLNALVPYFDWALNEQCFQYQECDGYAVFVSNNKAVFGVEYEGDPATYCPLANAQNFDWLKKNIDLDATRIACR